MQGNPLVNILPVIILAVFLYFVMIRPQSKRQKKVNDMLANMKIGDEVMTAGGFYGIINVAAERAADQRQGADAAFDDRFGLGDGFVGYGRKRRTYQPVALTACLESVGQFADFPGCGGGSEAM